MDVQMRNCSRKEMPIPLLKLFLIEVLIYEKKTLTVHSCEAFLGFLHPKLLPF